MKELLNNIEFANPEVLWLLLLLPALLVWNIFRQADSQATVMLSTLSFFASRHIQWRVLLRHILTALRLIAAGLVIVALARPQSSHSWEEQSVKGIDIVISLDVSGSMLAKDFEPNRLEVAKKVAADFVDGRKNDRFGFVMYEASSYPSCPITTDHQVVKQMIMMAQSGLMESGTAVGAGLVSAVNRLKKSDATSKVAILLTDGVNNAGKVSPLTAAARAEEYGIRVYTIGVGSRGKAYTPVARYPDGSYHYDYVDVDIDEQSLTEVAEKTGGKYFRATNEESLRNIYSEIDAMETNIRKVTEYMKKPEEFHLFLFLAVCAMLLEFLMKNTVLRTVT